MYNKISKPFLAFVLSALIFSLSGKSIILEKDKFIDVVEHVDENTLVLLDIDGVLYVPAQTLGCDKWAYYEGDKYIRSEGGLESGLRKFEPIWYKVQGATEVKLVDNGIFELIKCIKAKGASAIGLTARGKSLSEVTKKQFGSIGLSIDDITCFIGALDAKNFMLRNNVIFVDVGYGRKGQALEEFFKLSGVKPKKVLFIDDHKKNLLSVQYCCEKNNIDFTGIRFGAADHLTENFIPEVGDVQLYCFNLLGKIVSDNEAYRLIESFKKDLESCRLVCNEIFGKLVTDLDVKSIFDFFDQVIKKD